jgi:FkbM family methyltransferase
MGLKRWARAGLDVYLRLPGVVLSRLIGARRAEARVRASALRALVGLPVLYKDRNGLEYLLETDDWNLHDRFLQDGNYEIDEQEFCIRYLKPGMTVFDAGANYGTYAVLFCKLAGDENVHVFEPESRVYRRLRQNLCLNDFHAVHVNKLAVYSKSVSDIRLNTFPKERHGWSTLGKPAIAEGGEFVRLTGSESVAAVSLADYCREHGIQRVDFLKLDIEGAELDALEGAAPLLAAAKIRCILFEVSRPMVEGMNRDPLAIFRILRGHGYRIYSIEPRGALKETAGEPRVEYQNFIALAPGVEAPNP